MPLFVKQFEVTSKKNRPKLFEDTIQYLLLDFGVEFSGTTKDVFTRWFTESDKFGVVEYFPKGNKVHIHKEGTSGYKDGGLRWLIHNLTHYT